MGKEKHGGGLLKNSQLKKINGKNKQISGNINSLLDDMHRTTYGSQMNSDVDELDNMFNNIIKKELGSDRSADGKDLNSFIHTLASNQNRTESVLKLFDNKYNLGEQHIESIMTDAYRNRLIKQNDLHETASNLNELREAILITRDAIVSADTVEGHIARTITFKTDEFEDEKFLPIVEKVEERLRLKAKIKNFIVPKTLEYGEYYVYIESYNEIFRDFQTIKDSEPTLFETTTIVGSDNDLKEILSTYNESSSIRSVQTKELNGLKSIISNITISDNVVPLPLLENGIESIEEMMKHINTKREESMSLFEKVSNSIDGTGIQDKERSKPKNDFNIDGDCYIKFINPTKLIPLKIMDFTLGYYYIHDSNIGTDSTNLNNLYYDRFTGSVDKSLAGSIARLVVRSFSKTFVKDNVEFKDLIANAITFYNLTEKKIRFQFIPADKIIAFKVNEDEEGNGTSIIEPALFYAKLYLMLLLFKILTVVMLSNDTRVHYVKNTGLDKDVSNKIQDLARRLQQRQINMMDLFSYTTLINKVGQGSELFMPIGRNNEKGIETEILAGQDVQMNTDFMEMLRTSYISATGVPSVIMNYINEADFAKTIELANTRFQGRVVSFQLDFNDGISKMYKKILRYCTNIPDGSIDNFTFTFPTPKYTNSNTNNELISNFENQFGFVTSLFIDNDEAMNDVKNKTAISIFKRKLAYEKIPSIGIDIMKKLFDEAVLEAGGEHILKTNEEQT